MGGRAIKLSFDGLLVVDLPTSESVLPATEPVTVTTGLGVVQGVAGSTEMFVDNVVIETLRLRLRLRAARPRTGSDRSTVTNDHPFIDRYRIPPAF